jgi:4-carboxymuconolactone decarboxylase
MVTPATASLHILIELDPPTRALTRLSAVVTAGTDQEIHDAITSIAGEIPARWVEELLLQSYLFAGFPRALNAMREWRRVEPKPAATDVSSDIAGWRADGAVTCAAVYGPMYERLRENIRALHPLLDEWMITEGYGKVMSRPGLDLPRRELCIVAACAASNQDRQLLSHLHGALNVGVAPSAVGAAIEAITDLLGADRARSVALLWARVRGK